MTLHNNQQISQPPKRPPTAFFLFSQETRNSLESQPRFRTKEGKLNVRALTKELGTLWKKLSDDEKKLYLDQVTQLKEKYLQDIEQFKKENPDWMHPPQTHHDTMSFSAPESTPSPLPTTLSHHITFPPNNTSGNNETTANDAATGIQHDKRHLRIISGSSNPELAKKICEYLKHPLTPTTIRTFADGETWCQVQESVRGCDVFIVQSTCSPVNDNLMELLLLVDAIKRASARSITAVMPYYGYARQDRKTKARVPISAALVAKLIESAGVDRVCSMDLHCGQIQGFFRCAVDNLFGQPKLASAFVSEYGEDMSNDVVVVSPDAGGTERADYFRDALENQLSALREQKISMAMMNKKRAEHNKVAHMELIGDVEGKDCIIVDDMIDTAGTLCLAAKRLKESGAKRVFACASHGLLNGPGVKRITESTLERVFVLNTIPLPKEKQVEKIVMVSVADVLSQTITRIFTGSSISTLFGLEP